MADLKFVQLECKSHFFTLLPLPTAPPPNPPRLIITVRNEVVWQGNIFRSVCQEFCPRGECLPQCMLGYTTPPGQSPPGKTPPPGRPQSPWQAPPTPKWLLQRMVCILLERFLVFYEVEMT